jgi:MFS superfamily sulfate permease-like transporter
MLPNLRSDIRASVVVFLVALPLCLGIALASRAPLVAGLVAGIIGGLVASSLSGSRLSVSGPAAGLAVIVANGIGEVGSYEAFAVAVFLSGLIQIVFSVLKAGVIGNFFPTSVITGMLSAIGLLLILKQIPHAVGLDSAFMGSMEFFQIEDGENTFSELIRSFQVFDLECVVIAVLSFGVIQLWDRFSERMPVKWLRTIPSALLAVLAGIVVSRYGFHFFGMDLDPKHRVILPFSGGIGDLVAGLTRPDWSALSQYSTYVVAITIAMVGSLESLLSLDAADKIDPKRQNSSKNRELLAQGVSNSLSGILGGLPITAVIVRTSANVNAGAEGRLSGILHGVWLLLAVAFIPEALTMIPLSVLAVILILVGYKLTKPALYRKMYAKGMDQFVPFVVTISAILFTDLLKGVAIGMLVGFIFVIKRSHRKAMIMVEGEGAFFLLRFMKDISFLQKHDLVLHLRSVPAGATLEIDGGVDLHFDPDIIEVLEEFIEGAPKSSITVHVKKSRAAVSPFFRG